MSSSDSPIGVVADQEAPGPHREVIYRHPLVEFAMRWVCPLVVIFCLWMAWDLSGDYPTEPTRTYRRQLGVPLVLLMAGAYALMSYYGWKRSKPGPVALAWILVGFILLLLLRTVLLWIAFS